MCCCSGTARPEHRAGCVTSPSQGVFSGLHPGIAGKGPGEGREGADETGTVLWRQIVKILEFWACCLLQKQENAQACRLNKHGLICLIIRILEEIVQN